MGMQYHTSNLTKHFLTTQIGLHIVYGRNFTYAVAFSWCHLITQTAHKFRIPSFVSDRCTSNAGILLIKVSSMTEKSFNKQVYYNKTE